VATAVINRAQLRYIGHNMFLVGLAQARVAIRQKAIRYIRSLRFLLVTNYLFRTCTSLQLAVDPLGNREGTLAQHGSNQAPIGSENSFFRFLRDRLSRAVGLQD